MATDYASSPITEKGQIIFAVGCGFLTAIIRIYGGYPEGVVISPVLANLFLHYVFDDCMVKEFPIIPWARYADDGAPRRRVQVA